jgi:DNA-binding winged helix-turn-helix (wHTH) protein
MSLRVQQSQADLLFQMGKLYFERCDFNLANEIFEQSRAAALLAGDVERYSEIASIQLRIAAEREDTKQIEALKIEISSNIKKEKIIPSSRVYYSLGLCAAYQSDNSLALDYLERALALGLTNNDKVGICYAITGLVIVYTAMNKLDEALKEIYNLNVFFQVLDLPDLKLSTKLMNGHILRLLGKNEEALSLFNDCFENLKTNPSFFMHVNVLYALGVTYMSMQKKDQAALYLKLAQRSIDPKNMQRTHRLVSDKILELGEVKANNFDLIFNTEKNKLTERKRGEVDFGNQFILVDMLKLFLRKPGEVFSKEAIVKKVWKQDYDPRMHDNKLYVTIKRLRELIEPEIDKPRYIFRAKNGYYLNKNTRVLFNENSGI